MHRALEIQEILLDILARCWSPSITRRYDSDLVSLARTCRLFKEPALNVLWEELYDLSPLARCIPEACKLSRVMFPFPSKEYSLSRLLTPGEWRILLSYTRRIRSLVIDTTAIRLETESFKIFSDAPTTEQLFCNVRSLSCQSADHNINLLLLPFPSLVSLDLHFIWRAKLKDYLQSFPRFSPNLSKISVSFERHVGDTLHKTDLNYICGWRNLQALVSPDTPLDAELFTQLSCMPALTRLAFVVDVAMLSFDSPLSLSHLRDMELHCQSWELVSQFLSKIRLSTVTHLTAHIRSSPSRNHLTSLFTSLRDSGVSETIRALRLSEPKSRAGFRSSQGILLSLDDLRLCMAFSDLRCMELNISWEVGLTTSDLLALTSAWPYLEEFNVNSEWGWNTPGGITLSELLQLLNTNPSLGYITVAIDTRNHTNDSPSPESVGLMLPRPLHINFLDSKMNGEAIPVVSAFIASMKPLGPNITFSAWESRVWYLVQLEVQDILGKW